MELQVHRSRFVDWSPTGITCMAFPPVPPPSPHSPKDKIQEPRKAPPKWFGTLAIGRANGNIELLEWTGGPTDEVAPQAWALKRVSPSRNEILSRILTPFQDIDRPAALQDRISRVCASQSEALLPPRTSSTVRSSSFQQWRRYRHS